MDVGTPCLPPGIFIGNPGREEDNVLSKQKRETCLAVQWLRLQAANGGGVGLILGGEPGFLQAAYMEKKIDTIMITTRVAD